MKSTFLRSFFKQNDLKLIQNKILSFAKMGSAFVFLGASLVQIVHDCLNFSTAFMFHFSKNTTVQTQDHIRIPKSIVAFCRLRFIVLHPPFYHLNLDIYFRVPQNCIYPCENIIVQKCSKPIQLHRIRILRKRQHDHPRNERCCT